MTYLDIVQQRVRGELRSLGLAVVNVQFDWAPPKHFGPCEPRSVLGRCIACLMALNLEVLLRGESRQFWRQHDSSLYEDFAATLVKYGVSLNGARILTSYFIPTVVNYLLPRRFKWVWISADGLRVSGLTAGQQRGVYARLLAAGAVDPWWGEPAVLPQAVRLSREANPSHEIWPPRCVPTRADIAAVFGGAA